MAPFVAVCWKAVELRSRVDALTGTVLADPLSLGVSPADEAALEWALRCAEASGASLRVVSGGGEEAESVLRRAAAAGASELVRVVVGPDWPSEWVAHALAPHLVGASLVWCGDMSTDRGSGSVPAYLAAELGVAQALGLVSVALSAGGESKDANSSESLRIEALRRLDGGRRERLRVEEAAVLSCEGATARLRRAPLDALLAARQMPIAVHRAEEGSTVAPEVVSVGPYRPRARVVTPPPGQTARERIGTLIGVSTERRTARAVHLDPVQAGATILDALRAWGELP